MNDNEWKGKEKRSRRYMDDIKSEISEIKTDLKLLLNQVEANHESLRKSIDLTSNLVDRHEKTLYGNGNVGLTSKVNEFSKISDDLEKHTENDSRAYIGIYSVLAAILIGIGKLVFFK